MTPDGTGRRRTRVAVAVVVLLGAWAAVVAVLLVQARNDISVGLDAIAVARAHTAPDDLLDGRPLPHLRESRDAFARAERRLAHPLVTPLRLLPVAGRQLRSAAALAGAASEVSDVALDVVGEARGALREPHETGEQRIALLEEIGRLSARAERRLADLDLGPGRALVAPLAERRTELVRRLDDVRAALGNGRVAASGLAELLRGPRRYLVLAANNAEMRAGSGMFLSVGELTIAEGGFDLADLRWSGDLYVEDAPPPIADDDLAARWGWLNPNKEWRNLALSPRFEASAELAAAMWEATGAAPVDGVLALDPVAFRGVLQGTGPVQAGGRTLSADDVVDHLLHDQYLGLPPFGEDFDVAQAARREQLGGIADAVLAAVSQGRFDIGALGGGLAEAARGRHLLAWARAAGEQRMWEAAGVAGRVDERSLLVSVLNRGGNKLDRFLHVGAALAFGDAEDGTTPATLTLTLENRAPPGRPQYIEGPFPTTGLNPGDYMGIVSVTLPGFAGHIRIDGFDTYAVTGEDGPTQVVGVPVTLPRGESRTLTVRFALPGRSGELRIEPSARVPPVEWDVHGDSFRDRRPRTVPWG